MKQPIPFFSFQKHSIFMPFRFIYPECLVLIEPHQQLSPLHCLKGPCHVDKGCMEILARRVNYLFTHVCPDGQQIIAYFKYRDRPDSIRAGVFTRDLSEPRLMTLNKSAFLKFQKEGVTYQWIPSDEYLFIGRSENLIPVQNLLHKPDGQS